MRKHSFARKTRENAWLSAVHEKKRGKILVTPRENPREEEKKKRAKFNTMTLSPGDGEAVVD